MRLVGLVLAAMALGGPARAQDSARADSAPGRDSLGRFLLAPLEVTVTRTGADLTRVPYAVEAVARADFGRGRARLGLDEALAGVPGILAINRQNYAQDLVLSTRGFGSRSQFGVRGLKILLDGIPQTLPDGQGQLTNVVLDDVERVEVLRGSASSLYGNASGGVISLWTDHVRPRAVTPVARFIGGSDGLRKLRAGVDLPAGRALVSASGERTTTDGFRAHSSAEMRQARLRVAAPVGRTSIAFLAHLADNPQLQDPGALTRAEFDSDLTLANPINITRDAGKDVTQAQVGLTATRPVAGGGSVSATVFGLRRDLLNPIASAYIDLDRWAYGFRTSGTLPIAVGRGRGRGRGRATGTITAGLDGQWLRDSRINQNVTRTQVTRDQLELVTELGPFVQVVMTPWPSTTVTAGARYDRVRFRAEDHLLSDGDDSGTRIMSAASGSVGFAVQVRTGLVPYASVSTSFETPTTTELGNQPTAPGGFNPNLAPQKALNYEIGARGLLPGRVRYSVALYRADVRDELIPFDVPGAPGRRFFRNAGSSRHEGAEVGLTATPVSGIKVRGGYTYSRHRFLTYQTATANLDGRELPGVPRHYVSASATADVVGRGWLTVEETASSSYYVDDPNTVRNAAWASTGVRAGVDVRLAGWSLSAFGGVANLWNARYVGSVVVNAAGGRYFEPAPPRSFYLGAEIGAR